MIYSNTKNINENNHVSSFANLILECQENNMKIFNSILESDYEEAVKINEGTLLEGERALNALKTVKNVFAIILDGLKQFGQKLKQLFDAAVSKLKEIHTKRIAKFAEKFEKDFNPANYDESKIPKKENISYPLAIDIGVSVVNDIDIGELMRSAKSDAIKITNRVQFPDYVKEIISNAFKSSNIEAVKEMKQEYKNEKYITPSMFSKFITKYDKDKYSPSKEKANNEDYSAKYISYTVTEICKYLKDSNSYITKINQSRKDSFKMLNDVISEVKKSEKSLELTRACLELSSAYQTVISTIANTNIKVVMLNLKNNIKCLNLIKSACGKGEKKNDDYEGEDILNSTNEMFSITF